MSSRNPSIPEHEVAGDVFEALVRECCQDLAAANEVDGAVEDSFARHLGSSAI
jgi:hypothetical protein